MASSSSDGGLQALYDAHRWSELSVVASRGGSAFFRGAVAEMFNDSNAEALLKSVIAASPRSKEAYEAYEWLSHLYLRTGQYHLLMSTMEERWTAFPEKEAAISDEKNSFAPFRQLPDQRGTSSSEMILHHDGTIFVPLAVNSKPAKFFFDTGAWLSSMSESEAKRLGLDIRESAGSVGTAAGSGMATFHMAVAKEVVIGQTRFQNVSFAVFPDQQEPWKDLAPGQRGIIGVPLLLGCGRLRWAKDGTVAIGGPMGHLDVRKANLYFDDDHLVLTAAFHHKRILAVLDTGASTTDLYPPFAKQFADLVRNKGKRESKEIRGVGHTETFESVGIPELPFQIGTQRTVLRPAHIILRDIGPKCCIGNFGLDLLKQASSFEIDFGRMTIRLNPNR